MSYYNPNPRLPPTPKLSRKNFALADKYKIAAPVTTEEKACATDTFHTIVARIVNQAVPSITFADTDQSLHIFFTSVCIENENGLSIIESTDVPAINLNDRSNIWNNIVFCKGLLMVHSSCINFKLLSNTDYQLSNQNAMISKISQNPQSTTIESNAGR